VSRRTQVVFVISKASVKSKYCLEELCFAKKQKKRIVCALLEKCDHELSANAEAAGILKENQPWIDFTERRRYMRGLRGVLTALGRGDAVDMYGRPGNASDSTKSSGSDGTASDDGAGAPRIANYGGLLAAPSMLKVSSATSLSPPGTPKLLRSPHGTPKASPRSSPVESPAALVKRPGGVGSPSSLRAASPSAHRAEINLPASQPDWSEKPEPSLQATVAGVEFGYGRQQLPPPPDTVRVPIIVLPGVDAPVMRPPPEYTACTSTSGARELFLMDGDGDMVFVAGRSVGETLV
jgi:hypothetical protein